MVTIFGKIEMIIPVLHFAKRDLCINIRVKFHIYKATADYNEFNDKLEKWNLQNCSQ
jgi:hypothetical protein